MRTYIFYSCFILTCFIPVTIFAQTAANSKGEVKNDTIPKITLNTFSCVVWVEYIQAFTIPPPFGHIFFCKDIWLVTDKLLNTNILDTLDDCFFMHDTLKKENPKARKILNKAKRMSHKKRFHRTVSYVEDMKILYESNEANTLNDYKLNFYSYHRDSISKINRYVTAFNVEVVGLTVRNYKDASFFKKFIFGGHKKDNSCWRNDAYPSKSNRLEPLYCKKIVPLTEQQMRSFHLIPFKIHSLNIATH